MAKNFFDFTDGDLCMSLSDDMAMDMNGHLMGRLDDHAAMDLETGEVHFVSSWEREKKPDDPFDSIL